MRPNLHMVVVDVHAGEYLKHDQPPLPLVCTGCAHYLGHETIFEGIARALQHVYPPGPYPRVGPALTIFVTCDGVMRNRYDVVITHRGACPSVVSCDLPRYDLAPTPAPSWYDCVSTARGIFLAGLPPDDAAAFSAGLPYHNDDDGSTSS